MTDVCNFQYGYAFDSRKFSNEGKVPLVRIRDIVRGYSETYTDEDFDDNYLVHDGDMLIGMDGEFNIAYWHGGDAALNQRVCKLVPSDKVDSAYIFYRMVSVLKQIESKTPFVTVKHLSAKELNAVYIDLPNISEQKMQGKKLRYIDGLIAKNDSKLKIMDILVKSRFVEMFGDPVTNSHEWETMKLSELGELNRGVSKHRPRNAPELLNGPYPLVQTGDIANADTYIIDYSSTYSELGLKQSRMWSKGTLCITIAANIAKTGILTFDACFPDSVVGFVAGDRTNQLYMHHWFSFFQKILEEQAPQSAQKNINLAILSNLSVMLPPIELQNQFAEFVQQADKSKHAVQQSIETLQMLKAKLMQDYFG